ncbi:MAG TPA: hypothetical protein VJN42_07360 [Candidatus Acidoferrum sp.]|nr:hypothetical protein [Candidatus Acidoferrum sp.]
MRPNRWLVLLGGCLLAGTSACADELGYVDCASHNDTTPVFAKARKSQDIVAQVACGERFRVIVNGFVFSQIQTSDGKTGFIYSNVVTLDRTGGTLQTRAAASTTPTLSSASEKTKIYAEPRPAEPPRAQTAATTAAGESSNAAVASAATSTAPTSAPAPPAQADVNAAPAPAAAAASSSQASAARAQGTSVEGQLNPPAAAAQAKPAAAATALPDADAVLKATSSAASAPAPSEANAAAPAPATPTPAAPQPAADAGNAATSATPSAAPANTATPAPTADAAVKTDVAATGVPAEAAPAAQPQPEVQPGVAPGIKQQRWEKPNPGARTASLLELYGGFAFARMSNGSGYSGTNFMGGMGSFGLNLKPWIQIVGDTSYSFENASGTKNVVYGNHYGPRFFLRGRSKWSISPFGEVLVGGSRADTTVAASGGNPAYTTSQNCFSIKAGGGVDIRPSRMFEVRLVDVDYYRTAFGTNVHQSNYWISTGVVIRLLKPWWE